MINGKMWLVVKPTVGLPLFFTGVAVTSLVVHTALLTQTNIFSNYWNGRPQATRTSDATPAQPGVERVAAAAQDRAGDHLKINAQAK